MMSGLPPISQNDRKTAQFGHGSSEVQFLLGDSPTSGSAIQRLSGKMPLANEWRAYAY